MSKLLLAGAAGVTALAVGSVAAILILSDTGRAPPPVASSATPPTALAPAPTAAPAPPQLTTSTPPVAPAAPMPEKPGPHVDPRTQVAAPPPLDAKKSLPAQLASVSKSPVVPRGAPKQKATDPYATVPVQVGTPATLQAVATAAREGLQGVTDQPACDDPAIQARIRAPRPIMRRPGQDADPRRPTLLLSLEAVDANQTIVFDVVLEKQGNASDALVLCTQAALRGATLRMPGAEKGAKYRVRYPL